MIYSLHSDDGSYVVVSRWKHNKTYRDTVVFFFFSETLDFQQKLRIRLGLMFQTPPCIPEVNPSYIKDGRNVGYHG